MKPGMFRWLWAILTIALALGTAGAMESEAAARGHEVRAMESRTVQQTERATEERLHQREVSSLKEGRSTVRRRINGKTTVKEGVRRRISKKMSPDEARKRNTTCDEEEANQGKQVIKILSNNITSWRKRGEAIMDEEVDILALQEVRIGRIGTKGARKMAARKGWQMQLGREQLLEKKCARKTKVGFRREAVRAVKKGGVAILAREGRNILKSGKADGPARFLEETRRWTRCAIPIGKKRRGV